ncbi:unnamed protein product [Amoebophrya sp. A120]|nr:unnamed protein product [Amoebophrya sp. A120]|eukprot:GSA120T00023576001.1
MLLCQQDEHVAREAAIYCRAASLGLLPMYIADTWRKFFVNIGRTNAIQTMQICTTLLHWLWCFLFVGYYQLENFGVGLANSCTNMLTFLFFGYQYYALNLREFWNPYVRGNFFGNKVGLEERVSMSGAGGNYVPPDTTGATTGSGAAAPGSATDTEGAARIGVFGQHLPVVSRSRSRSPRGSSVLIRRPSTSSVELHPEQDDPQDKISEIDRAHHSSVRSSPVVPGLTILEKFFRVHQDESGLQSSSCSEASLERQRSGSRSLSKARAIGGGAGGPQRLGGVGGKTEENLNILYDINQPRDHHARESQSDADYNFFPESRADASVNVDPYNNISGSTSYHSDGAIGIAADQPAHQRRSSSRTKSARTSAANANDGFLLDQQYQRQSGASGGIISFADEEDLRRPTAAQQILLSGARGRSSSPRASFVEHHLYAVQSSPSQAKAPRTSSLSLTRNNLDQDLLFAELDGGSRTAPLLHNGHLATPLLARENKTIQNVSTKFPLNHLSPGSPVGQHLRFRDLSGMNLAAAPAAQQERGEDDDDDVGGGSSLSLRHERVDVDVNVFRHEMNEVEGDQARRDFIVADELYGNSNFRVMPQHARAEGEFSGPQIQAGGSSSSSSYFPGDREGNYRAQGQFEDAVVPVDDKNDFLDKEPPPARTTASLSADSAKVFLTEARESGREMFERAKHYTKRFMFEGFMFYDEGGGGEAAREKSQLVVQQRTSSSSPSRAPNYNTPLPVVPTSASNSSPSRPPGQAQAQAAAMRSFKQRLRASGRVSSFRGTTTAAGSTSYPAALEDEKFKPPVHLLFQVVFDPFSAAAGRGGSTNPGLMLHQTGTASNDHYAVEERSGLVGLNSGRSYSLHGLRKFLKISVPTAWQIVLEWCLWEVMAICAGLIGPGALACHVAGLTVYTVVFTGALGLASTAAQVVGNSLGEGRPRQARKNAATCVWYSVFTSVIVMIIGNVAARGIADFYFPIVSADGTSLDDVLSKAENFLIQEVEPQLLHLPSSTATTSTGGSRAGEQVTGLVEVKGGQGQGGTLVLSAFSSSSGRSGSTSTSSLLFQNDRLVTTPEEKNELLQLLLKIIFTLSLLPDCVQNVAVGVLRACSWSDTAAGMYLVQHYLFGFPLGLFLVLKYHSLILLWLALVLDLFCGCALTLFLVFNQIDWRKESQTAIERSVRRSILTAATG